jgi:hypothetical protein
MKDPLYFLRKTFSVTFPTVKDGTKPIITRPKDTDKEYLNIFSLLLASCDLIGLYNSWIDKTAVRVDPANFLKDFKEKKCVIGLCGRTIKNLTQVIKVLSKYKYEYIFIIAEDVYPASNFLKHDPEILDISDKIYFKNLDTLNPKCLSIPLGCGFWIDKLHYIEYMRSRCLAKSRIMSSINSSTVLRKNKIFNDYTTTRDGKFWRVGNFNTRLECLEFMKKNKDTFESAGIEIDIVEQRIPQEESWKKYKESRFVLSPPGNGYDCHRHFESIVLGAIPIFIRTPLMTSTVYAGFPYIELNSIKELTPELLNNYEYKEFDKQMLEVQYWVDKIRST